MFVDGPDIRATVDRGVGRDRVIGPVEGAGGGAESVVCFRKVVLVDEEF